MSSSAAARAATRHRSAPGILRWGAAIAGVLLRLTTRTRSTGGHHLPASGSFIVASNHLSAADPVVLGQFLAAHGAPPHFLAKHSLFGVPVLGRLLRAGGQIPVHRNSSRAGDSLVAARRALAAGHCVVVYPEGTFTTDPKLWPMAGRSGVGRLALASGRPVIPVGHWGVQNLLARGGRLPKICPRPRIEIRAGAPVELSDLYGREDPAAAREATDRIMAAITDVVAELRGEPAPPGPQQ